MKLSIVIPIMNQHDMCHAVIEQLCKVTSNTTEIIVIDNGSTIPFTNHELRYIDVIRNEKSVGVYPTFKQGFDNAHGDIVAFFHSDLIVWEEGWDTKVIQHFKVNPHLGMIGSSEIDQSGGRGLGTTSNFAGKSLGRWAGSAGHIHGKQSANYSNAAVVDGCAMIIRRSAWEHIGVKQDFPPHHFYDRLISTQLLEKHWQIGVLGIACDHFSGQTVNQENAYSQMAQDWATQHNITIAFHQNSVAPNWDATIYQEAERRWLREYRDEKHIVPIHI